MSNSFDIPTPNITGASEKEQLSQIKTHLIQLSDTLNWALNAVGSQNGVFSYYAGASGKGGASIGGAAASIGGGHASSGNLQGASQFEQLKDLIIKSADVVEAFSEEIERRLKGKYVAKSDFGTYQEQTDARFSATSEGMLAEFSNLQEIIKQEGASEEIDSNCVLVNATIRAGNLYEEDGNPIYGIEIGQKSEGTGREFEAFARFVSEKITFYDKSGQELASFGKQGMKVSNAVITGNIQIGNYLLDSSDGLLFRYVGT